MLPLTVGMYPRQCAVRLVLTRQRVRTCGALGGGGGGAGGGAAAGAVPVARGDALQPHAPPVEALVTVVTQHLGEHPTNRRQRTTTLRGGGTRKDLRVDKRASADLSSTSTGRNRQHICFPSALLTVYAAAVLWLDAGSGEQPFNVREGSTY